MIAELGFITLAIAFVASIYSIVTSVVGEVRRNERIVLSGRNAALLTTGMVTVSVIALQTALIQQEYHISYVWSVSNPAMPTFFRWTALWGSQAGSLLFWTFVMVLFTAGAILLNWRTHRRLMPYAIAYMMAVVAFFLGLSLFLENPFDRWWILSDGEVVANALIPAGASVPTDARLAETARGLNPLLRHFGMAIHPPMLYLGFVGFLIPFAFGMAALASGDLSTNWIKASRGWALVAWLFLSLGLILGGRWAYDVLGWGGYWGWDPVENAAFLPWLMGTAYLHSVMIQEKRGMLKTWNMLLVVATFSAVIFGTFATRSGLVESVHSFARSEIGFPLFFFWLSITLISVVLIAWRRSRGELQDDHKFSNLLSRESLFVLNNFIFMALFAVIFWGSFGAPISSELFLDTNITLGTDYFMKTTPWLFAALYLLMGVAPLSAWTTTSASRLGRALVVPVILTIVTVAVFIMQGMDTPVAIAGYAVVSLAGWVALYEIYRGVVARVRAHRENPVSALIHLVQRNPRRYGGYMVHFGIVVIGIGVIGSTLFQSESQRTLQIGESMFIENYELRYENFRAGQVSQDGRIMDIADLTVIKDGTPVATISPRRDFFPENTDMNTMTIAGAHSTVENDFYVLLVGWEEISSNAATFKVYINPLINLVWWGGLILILGTVMAFFPKPALASRKVKSAQALRPVMEGVS